MVWRRLQTSDHFYYMCTKGFSDDDVHKYFNPYGNPYDAYINFMNVLGDFELTLEQSASGGSDPAAEKTPVRARGGTAKASAGKAPTRKKTGGKAKAAVSVAKDDAGKTADRKRKTTKKPSAD
jgi:hypothetical protein